MDYIGHDDLIHLAEHSGSTHVSVFAPMVRRGMQTAQNPVRWQNQLRRAEDALRDGTSIADPDALLAPAHRLVRDRLFWEYQSEGLAYFATPDWAKWFRVPTPLPELVAVGRRFAIAPMLDVLAADGSFQVLALDQRQVRLFDATRFAIAESDVALPAAEPSVLSGGDARQRPHAFLAGRGGVDSGTVVFGTGAPAERDGAERTRRYFRAVDAALHDAALNDAAGPSSRPPKMLLAGDARLLSYYRQVSRRPGLLDVELAGNPSGRDLDELHAAAWVLVEPVLRREEGVAVAQFRQEAGTGRTLTDPAGVLEAAGHGRVATMLLSSDVFAPVPVGPHAVLRLGEEPRGVADLLDEAAGACLATGGTVRQVSAELMPVPGPVAALLRY